MVGKEGRINKIGIVFCIGGMGLFLRRGKRADGFLVVRRPQHRSNLAAGICKGEIEQAGNAAFIVFRNGLEALPDLRHQVGIRVQLFCRVRDEFQDFHIFLGVTGNVFLRCIQTEAGNAPLHPKAHDVPDFRPQLRAVQIQVGHLRPEASLIVPLFPGQGVVSGVWGILRKVVKVYIGADGGVRLLPRLQTLQISLRFLEPGVHGGGVVEHQVENHRNAPLLAGSHEIVKILQRAKLGVDAIIVHDIILMVSGGRMDGGQPDAAHTQLLQIVQLRGDAVQVTHSVPVGIAEGIDKNFIKGGIAALLILQVHPRRVGGEASKRENGGEQQGENTSAFAHGFYPFTPPAMAS